MLLFQGLQRHVLGDRFRYQDVVHNKEKRVELNKYYRVLGLFMDNIESQHVSPFGIHSIAQVGLSYRRKPGDWFGPQAICNVLSELNKQTKPLTNFSMVVCNDGNVFLDKISKKIAK